MPTKTKIILPKKERLPVLAGDHLLDVYYHPWKSFFFRHRLRMILSLMERRFSRLLDLGCGSGIFLPSLRQQCLSLYACDIHNGLDKVRRMLDWEEVQADVFRLDILQPQTPNTCVYTSYFDGIVCMSVLEHIQPKLLPEAVANMQRMLSAEGELFLGIPVDNLLARFGHNINRYDYRQGHLSNERDIISAVANEFEVTEERRFPDFFKFKASNLYITLKLKKKKR